MRDESIKIYQDIRWNCIPSSSTGHRGLADLQKEQLGRALATSMDPTQNVGCWQYGYGPGMGRGQHMSTLDIPDGLILESDQNPRAPVSKFKMGIAQPLESRP